ncbi:hypothetical protein BDV28DRAFT_126540 [Aspergillus coremiiformis]|uniref:Uncharacterized protein n=1 Tax=Aspergillus coremiiformis TaxID=138285 RepID=A0A5N6ZGN0_9EURO|nr:hypothetical protein BDV28DRAFT_126540 [Aspergillus coremiiformis]
MFSTVPRTGFYLFVNLQSNNIYKLNSLKPKTIKSNKHKYTMALLHNATLCKTNYYLHTIIP